MTGKLSAAHGAMLNDEIAVSTAINALLPATWAMVAVADILPLTKFGAFTFSIAFGACVGLLIMRFVVHPALADRNAT